MTDRLYDRRDMLKLMGRTGVCLAAMLVVGCGGENVMEKEKERERELAGPSESTEVPP